MVPRPDSTDGVPGCRTKKICCSEEAAGGCPQSESTPILSTLGSSLSGADTSSGARRPHWSLTVALFMRKASCNTRLFASARARCWAAGSSIVVLW